MKYIVDRIEGGYAVCETENMGMVNIELTCLPKGVREGSILTDKSGGFTFDKAEENSRRSKLNKLQNSLFDE